jgi:PPM family protein phosphatase
MTIVVEAAGKTHVGLVRRRNEDALHVGQSLFAIADGLGGHPAGDVASDVVIQSLKQFDRPSDPDELPTTLGRAIKAANEALAKRIADEPELAGMGSTLVALMWSDTTATIANLGDCRAYLARRQASGTYVSIKQITEDHTYAHLVADAEDVPNLPERLARWLDGRSDGRSPDLASWNLRDGDRFLLCSDGLSSYVPLELIEAAVRSSLSPSAVAERLVAAAMENGGPDNVTVLVVDVHETRSAQQFSPRFPSNLSP